MKQEAKLTGAWSQLAVRGLESLDVDVRDLCRSLDLPYAALVDPDAWVPCDGMALLWGAAASRTGIPNLGLQAAVHVDPPLNHILAHVLVANRNLLEGLRATQKMLPTLGDGAAMSLEEGDDHFRMTWRSTRGELPPGRHAVEFGAVMLWKFWGLTQQSTIPLDRVDFAHAAPEDVLEHERVFGCPVRFAQPADGFVIPRSAMLRRSVHYSPELARRFRDVAQAHLERTAPPSFADELHAALASRLHGGPWDADSIAAELHISVRTLQRRVESEGTSYSEILDRVRREKALELIETDLPLREIAVRCGLSSPRSLIRAFRRWTGSTPSEHRKRSRSRATPPPPPAGRG